MKKAKSTNPTIDGKPLSFVRLGSRVAGHYSGRNANFSDSRGVPYVKHGNGMIVRVRPQRNGESLS